jgi:nucleoside-diphosphate-sugar epimerase
MEAAARCEEGPLCGERIAAVGGGVAEVFVTGGRGFVARHLAHHLASRGHRVTLLFRKPPSAAERSLYPANARFRTGDLLGRRGHLVPDGAQFVYHLAARVSSVGSEKDPVGFFDVNAMGTVRLLEEIRTRGLKLRRFVLPSTALVYAQPTPARVKEDHATHPQTPYAASKLGAEAYALACGGLYDIPVTVLRLFNIYGPGQNPEYVVPSILRQCLFSKTLKIGNPWPLRDFLYVDDAARLFVAAASATAARGEVLNVGSGKGVQIETLARLASRVTHAGLTPRTVAARSRKHDVDRLVADITGARRLVGWKPLIPLSEGLRRTAEALNQN